MILALIDKVDNSELIRDELGAILLSESASQQALATTAGKDPRLWALRVFVEHSNPWSEFEDAPDQIDATPIVNVAFDRSDFDQSAGNVIDRQRASCLFHVDCYGYGVSSDAGGGGHIAGDKAASLEVQRAVRLVRNILMSDSYVYLGHRGIVARRWLNSIQVFQPPADAQTVQKIVGARLTFEVLLNEFGPQTPGEVISLVSVAVKRGETGELYFNAAYDE
jgi:hypothetical protein